MKTRNGLTALVLLWAAGAAVAQDAAPDTTASPAETAAAPAAAQAPQQAVQSKPKRRQGRDMRRCLKLETNEAIIRCAEPGRKP